MLSRIQIDKVLPGREPSRARRSKSTPEYASADETSGFEPSKFSYDLSKVSLSTRGRALASASRVAPGLLPWPIQAKLEVGGVDDPPEREADRLAEQVMRMPAAGLHNSTMTPGAEGVQDDYPTLSDHPRKVQRKCSCGGSCDKCKSETSEDESGQMQRKPADTSLSGNIAALSTAPPLVHDVLRSPGHPLDATTLAFFESRFGRKLNDVRVHADASAADSAAAVGALAYTVGPNVVFGRARYSPHSASGQQLLAHELAHVIQQSHPPDTLRRKPCLHGSDCKFIPGDTGRFVEGVDAPPKKGEVSVEIGHVEILTPDPSAPKGAPVKPPPSRQGLLAPNLRKLVENSGFKISPEASGPFIDEGLSSKVGAQAVPCSSFPDGLPKGAPKDGCCIQIYPEMENRATKLLASKAPRTAAQDADALELVGTVLHEAEHCDFDRSPATAKKIPAEFDCNLSTVVFHGPRTNFDFTVKFYLSELSAEIAQFPPYFQTFEKSPTKANHDLLHQKEIDLALNKGESIRGIIHGLKCACSCESVDHLVENAVHDVIDSWPKDQASKFLEVMARIMPSWWPRKLRTL